jgi:hypothetical protein
MVLRQMMGTVGGVQEMALPYDIFDLEYRGGEEQHIWGFKEAADALVEFAVSGRRFAWPAPLFCPILFLYRHYLEINLKYWTQKLTRKPARHGHNLMVLWDVLKQRILEVCKTAAERELLQEVEDVVRTFHQYDESSEESRYTKMAKKKGEKTNPRDMEAGQEEKVRDTLSHIPSGIDVVENLKDRISRVDRFFEGLSEVNGF